MGALIPLRKPAWACQVWGDALEDPIAEDRWCCTQRAQTVAPPALLAGAACMAVCACVRRWAC